MIQPHLPTDDSQDPWELLYSSDKSYQVEILKSLLEEAEIDAVVLNHQDSSYILFGEIELYVYRSDVLLARQILSKFLERE
jgi:hypothetical protein